SRYGREIARYAEDLARSPAGRRLIPDLTRLAVRARLWSRAAGISEKLIARRVAGGTKGLHVANDWLLSTERSMLEESGLPHRPWFRHLIYAPLPSYAAETLPAVREAAEAGQRETARREAARLVRKLDAAMTATRRVR
ncbi:MAG TPA: transferrin receptor-like dimerization domain-containing protein, partial [Thermoanaerobaculia bacterium]|nr:transferrin receptor-like dimerization domain-containing protein [Thermoanaerobaculia bacterium]